MDWISEVLTKGIPGPNTATESPEVLSGGPAADRVAASTAAVPPGNSGGVADRPMIPAGTMVEAEGVEIPSDIPDDIPPPPVPPRPNVHAVLRRVGGAWTWQLTADPSIREYWRQKAAEASGAPAAVLAMDDDPSTTRAARAEAWRREWEQTGVYPAGIGGAR